MQNNRIHIFCATLLLPLLFVTAGEAFAQMAWNPERDNSVVNLRSGSLSPVSLSYNPSASRAAATAAWNAEQGDFHRPDSPAGKSELELKMEELGTHGKVRTQGGLSYRNTTDFARNWSSLIGNDPDNPYVICDTLADNSSTERFDLYGVVSWNASERLRFAARAALTAATLADNNDPRPKNDISRIPILAGAEYSLGKGWTAGAFGGAELFFSRFTNYLEYSQKAYRYYKMKGMGDFFAFSSSESSSAPREYSGVTYTAGLNLGFDGKRLGSFTEFGFRSGNENARDGGSAYEWKAGDYEFMQFSLHQRIDLKGSLRQSVILDAGLKTMAGYWYDQTLKKDTEHGNISYYEIQSRYKNNDATRLTANLLYRIGRSGDWGAEIDGSFLMENSVHYADGEPRTQSWNLLEAGAGGWKTFEFGNNLLDVSAKAGYVLPLGEPVFDTGFAGLPKDDITAFYVTPAFEYETASKIKAQAALNWVLPKIGTITPAVFAKGSLLASLQGKYYYGFSAGVTIIF